MVELEAQDLRHHMHESGFFTGHRHVGPEDVVLFESRGKAFLERIMGKRGAPHDEGNDAVDAPHVDEFLDLVVHPMLALVVGPGRVGGADDDQEAGFLQFLVEIFP